jgi:hypothetical protein
MERFSLPLDAIYLNIEGDRDYFLTFEAIELVLLEDAK